MKVILTFVLMFAILGTILSIDFDDYLVKHNKKYTPQEYNKRYAFSFIYSPISDYITRPVKI